MSELGYFAFEEAKRHGVPVRICHAHNAPDFKHENLIQYIKLIPRYYFIRRIRHLTTDFFVCSNIAGVWLYGKERQNEFVFMRNAIETEKFLYNVDETNAIIASSDNIVAESSDEIIDNTKVEEITIQEENLSDSEYTLCAYQQSGYSLTPCLYL